MTNTRALELGLRATAIAIAVAAVVDPMITVRRTTRPIVSIVATAASEALASRVERTIEKTATVVRAPTSAADASILVGDALPSPLGAVTSPVFAVLGDRSDASVSIAALRAPAWTPLDARVPVTMELTSDAGWRVSSYRAASFSAAAPPPPPSAAAPAAASGDTVTADTDPAGVIRTVGRPPKPGISGPRTVSATSRAADTRADVDTAPSSTGVIRTPSPTPRRRAAPRR